MVDMTSVLRHAPRVSSPLNPSLPTSPRSPPPPINALRRRHKHKSVGVGELLQRIKGAVAWEQTKKSDLEVEVDDGAGNIEYYYTPAPPPSPRDVPLDCDGDVPMLMDDWADNHFHDARVGEDPSDAEDDRPGVEHWGGGDLVLDYPSYLRGEEYDEDSANHDGHESGGDVIGSVFENMDGMEDVEYTVDGDNDNGPVARIEEYIEVIPWGSLIDLEIGMENPDTTTTPDLTMLEINGLNSAETPRRERPRLTRSTQMIHRPETWVHRRLASPGSPVNGLLRPSNGMAGQDHPPPGPPELERNLDVAVDYGPSADDNVA